MRTDIFQPTKSEMRKQTFAFHVRSCSDGLKKGNQEEKKEERKA
jgi:hypothetical protein